MKLLTRSHLFQLTLENHELTTIIGKWIKAAVSAEFINKPTEMGSRGSIPVDSKNDTYLILSGNTDSSLSIMKVGKKRDPSVFEVLWNGYGFDGGLQRRYRLNEGNVNLSIFTRTDKKVDGNRDIVILDFNLELGR